MPWTVSSDCLQDHADPERVVQHKHASPSALQNTLESAIEVSDVANTVVNVINLGVRESSARGCAVRAEGSSVDAAVLNGLASLLVVLHSKAVTEKTRP